MIGVILALLLVATAAACGPFARCAWAVIVPDLQPGRRTGGVRKRSARSEAPEVADTHQHGAGTFPFAAGAAVRLHAAR